MNRFILFALVFCTTKLLAQGVWVPDSGDGTYKNPVIFADYSDPDICRVGNDFYMTSSSFNAIPGLPILHSTDLVNWTIINHALQSNTDPYYDIPQHGNGVWAPSMRYHEGMFYIYWGDPDRGIFMVKTDDPRGDWSAPELVKKAYGNIDPCPLWDDDGKVYLVHAFAHSRAGINSTLQINELTPEGDAIVDKGIIVVDGHRDHPTLEGPKFYKRNDFYYIFAPAGGVPTGWQVVFRSKNVYGPYDSKIVLSQGGTEINGPHQGGFVELENGESWFVHFQDREEYGRIVHLQPVRWVDDWPVMGNDRDGDGNGEPVLSHRKPGVKGKHQVLVPQTSDEFTGGSLGLQWQWSANPKPGWYSFPANRGILRLNSAYTAGLRNLWMLPNMLTQKLPAPDFEAVTQINVSGLNENEQAGLLIFGLDYAGITIQRTEDGISLRNVMCIKADLGSEEEVLASVDLRGTSIRLKIIVGNGRAVFSYSSDGREFIPLGSEFRMREGKWVGAKIALYSYSRSDTGEAGYSEVEYLRVGPVN